jgi:hypothetical protein
MQILHGPRRPSALTKLHYTSPSKKKKVTLLVAGQLMHKPPSIECKLYPAGFGITTSDNKTRQNTLGMGVDRLISQSLTISQKKTHVLIISYI